MLHEEPMVSVNVSVELAMSVTHATASGRRQGSLNNLELAIPL
jgi:hypothetical protein